MSSGFLKRLKAAHAALTCYTAFTCWGRPQPIGGSIWGADRHFGKKTQPRCHARDDIILSVLIFIADFICCCALQPRAGVAADQSAQNHVFASSFWLLWHHFLVFIFAKYAIWLSDQFISKLGDFYHIDLTVAAW